MRKQTLPEIVLVTVFGTGYSPIAPATVASAVTCVIIWFVPWLVRWPQCLLVVPTFFIGVWLSQRAIGAFEIKEDTRFAKLRRPDPKSEDPDQVVFDELVGQWVTLLAVPHTLWGFAGAFVLFRVLDIAKPLGIRHAQKAARGWGVMLDDVLAGVYGAIVLFLVTRFLIAS